MSDALRPHGLQHAMFPCPSPGACLNSCPLSQWCHPTISSSVIPFSFCLHSFPASGSFQLSWLFASGGKRIGASGSASVLPMNIQGWFPLELTGLISLLSKGLTKVFSCTTIQKHQFFASDSQNIGTSASASVLTMNIQGWFPLELTHLISLLSKGLSRVFSNTTVEGIDSSALSLLYGPALTSIHDHWKSHSSD